MGVREVLSRYKVSTVSFIKNCYGYSDESFLPVQGATASYLKRLSEQNHEGEELHIYNTALWNPIHFAIYYRKVDIARMLLMDFSPNFIMAQRLPPPNELVECVIPYQKHNISKDVKSGGRFMSTGSPPAQKLKSPFAPPMGPVTP
mmetsp:Transcript_40850/g.30067  ORF Transcript_40850/g.30067 Transcript_40850/m.30067 type:complete len:146 (+) Transcript_40850:1206-1643(+)